MSSYRPISLLNADLKLLSKILATRLESLLPLLIKDDQTGFIKGRNSCNNMRRLLNTIQVFQQRSLNGLVLSLDAEKAFDRVEMPFLFYTLHKFDLGEKFISWIKLLYTNPLSAVLTNGLCSSNFQILRGTRQGCPLSPLLFALVIEPLAEAIKTNESIHGLTIDTRQHKITLYADDVLIVLTEPEISTPALIETINVFSTFSGYRINFSKSEVMPLGSLKQIPQNPSPFPFKWSPEGFVYLGIRITPSLDQLYKTNFPPIFERIRLDLERWNTLPVSWLGRVALLKMNILPRLLYPIQMIPVMFLHKTIKQLNSWFSSFIRSKRKPHLKVATLCLSYTEEGVDLPDIRKFQFSVYLRTIADWMGCKSTSLWLDIESSMSKYPLSNLLFIRKSVSLKSACTNPITISTVKAWHAIRKLEGRSQFTSVFTPICDNPDFPPGMMDNNFRIWANKGISTLHNLLEGSTMLSFNQLERKYDIQHQDFFRFFQVRNFVTKDTTILECQYISHVERQLLLQKSGTSISLFYNILRGYNTINTYFLKGLWETELNVKITDEDWNDAWKLDNG